MHTFPRILLCSLFAVIWVAPYLVSAQVNQGDEVPDVTRTYALTNARVVQAPGRVMESATVIIRDGLIAALGPNVNIPFDAATIAADSFTVYAGFIDGLSHTGIPEPRERPTNQERPDDPGNPPNEEAGIQPERDVRALLDPEDKRLASLRNAGFTAVHVVPRGRMLPGIGAIILLAGDDANELVYRGETSLFAQFASARRMYPGTDMAVIAKLRQLFREADRLQRIESMYASDPSGMERPPYDPVHYALFPVLSEERPVFFHTEDVLDLHRVLDVQSELGFPVVLTGLSQSFDALDKLRDAGYPLMLSLDLPTVPRQNDDDDTSPRDSARAEPTDSAEKLPELAEPVHNPDFRVRSLADLDDEKKNLELRRDLEHKKYLQNAAGLHAAGVAFGFTTRDAEPSDLLDNVRTMIENGLSEDAALAALTTTPAEILGVSGSMGSVEVGKMANLVVTEGPVFDEDGIIRYVFVDGHKFEIDEPRRSSGGSGTGVSPAGTWSFVVSTPDGDVNGSFTIRGSEGNWTGTIANEMSSETATLLDITLEGDQLSFSFVTEEVGRATISVEIAEDQIEGEVEVADFGSMPLSGERTGEPESTY